MDATAHAERQKADGLASQAQDDFPKLTFPARQSIDRTDQSHSARLGELLRDRTFEPVLRVHRVWVEKKIRRHLARAAQRQGFGWKRWSREWLYGTLGLFYG